MADETAGIFNAAIHAASISALFELGLLEELERTGEVRVREFCDARGLHRMSVEALLKGLQSTGVVRLSPEEAVVRPGEAFAATFRNKGYFLWLVRGYGAMLRNLASIARLANRSGHFIERSGKFIALAGRDYGAQFVDRDFMAVLDQEPFEVAADLGCGSGERLIRLAQERPSFRGIGVDMNEDAVALAQEAVIGENLQDRVTVVHGDVKALAPHPEFQDADVIFSFFMGHDLWPRSNCLYSLNQIHAAFPRAARFLLCDTYRSDAPPTEEPPIFTLGFEVTHAVMGQYVPSVAEWLDLFEETAWRCAGRHEIGIPFSCVFDLRRREGA